MDDNFILPFQLESSRIRGRIVRVGSVLDDILSAHKTYQDDVLHLTGEMLTLCAMLSSMLKYEGVFTLQTQGDGPLKMLVADMTSDGGIRACATFKEEISEQKVIEHRTELLGKGYMAFTVDQGGYTDRYQGIVELKDGTLIESVQNYFAQSEQIATGMMMAVGKVNGKWQGCGIMVQRMPEDSTNYNKDSNVHEDDWRRTMVLLGSVKDEEMLNAGLPARDLLFRLFHEEGVRIYDPQELKKTCRCSPERVRGVLSTMSDDDIRDITVDDKIVMTCEFCSTDYTFDPKDFEKGSTA